MRRNKRAIKSSVRSAWIHSAMLHVVMYTMLLVATPFLMCRNYLQEAIFKLGRLSVAVGGVDIVVVPTLAAVTVILLLIYYRAYLSKLSLLAGVIAVLMNAVGQSINDYYFAHEFYDLQQNWHYVAYAIFAFMLHRALTPHGMSLSRIMLITFVSALLFSSADEVFQQNMSGRAFEMGDIAKDTWGTLIGMVVVYLGGARPGARPAEWRPIRHSRMRAYLQHPPSLFLLLLVLVFLFLCFSSLLGSFEYWKLVILFTVCTFVAFFLLFHVSQFKWGKYGLSTVVVLALAVQGYSFFKHRADGIIQSRPGLVMYKGIPIPFFDVMIWPDGSFRLVDRKASFRLRIQQFFLQQKADIVVVGSGTSGEGGKGFPKETVSQFMYNRYLQRGTQVIILENPEACRCFNRLMRERKNVLLVLHNTF